jgi:hypothetical protein
MEMDNAALMQVLNTQNMLLQNMQGNQAVQGAQSQGDKAVLASAVAQASQSQRPMPAMSPYNGYQMYEPLVSQATPIYGSGKKEVAQSSGMISQAVNNYLDYDPSRNSKESTSDMFAEQTKLVQDKVIGAGSAVAQGAAFAGSFLIPGLLPSLAIGAGVGAAVGGTVGAVSDGAETSNKIQEILRKKGTKAFNAFESTTEFGGAGIDLEGRQDLAKHIRHLAPEKLLEDQEMQQILGGALDNKLLKSATDIEGFKKKFDSIVDQVKQITLTMNQSIEEATAFMGELERRGVGSQDMSSMSARIKVVSSLWGTDPSKAAEKLMGTSDAITQGTSLDAKNVMGTLTYSATLGTMLEEKYKKSDDQDMYHYLKNNGGADQVSMNTERSVRGYLDGQEGRNNLIGLFGGAIEQKGKKFEFNMEKFNELTEGVENGSLTLDSLRSSSANNLQQYSNVEQAKIVSSASESFSNKANGADIYKYANAAVEAAMKQGGIDDKSVAIQQLGLARSSAEAEHLENLFEMNKNEDIGKLMTAKSIREEMDSYSQSNATGIMKGAKYWWKRNVSSHFGDAGQYVSDGIANFSTDFQKWQTGIGDRSIIGGEVLDEFSADQIRDTKGVDAINKVLKGNVDELRSKKGMDVTDAESAYKMEKGIISLDKLAEDKRTRISKESFSGIVDRIDDDSITGSELKKLQDKISGGKLEGVDKRRAEYATNKASGKYDGFLGTVGQFADRSMIALSPETPIWGSGKDLDRGKVDMSGNLNDTISSLEESGKNLNKEGKDLSKKIKKVFSNEKLTDVDEKDYTKLESLIKSGNVDEVEKMTSNSKVRDLAKDYQKFTDKQNDQEGALKAAKDMGRQSEGYARLAEGVSEFVGITGALDEEGMNKMFKSYKAYGDSFKEQLKEGKLSVTDLKEQSDVMLKQGKEIFDNMSPEQLKKVAQGLQEKSNGQISMDKLMSNGTVDSQKVFNAIANDVVREGHADKTDNIVNGKEGKDGDKKMSAAAKDHEKALGTFVETMTKEAKQLKDATNSIKNGSYRTKNTYSG